MAKRFLADLSNGTSCLSIWVKLLHYCYVTIVDARRGGFLLRKTEYHGDIRCTFIELARKHAPWALEQIASREWGSSQ